MLRLKRPNALWLSFGFRGWMDPGGGATSVADGSVRLSKDGKAWDECTPAGCPAELSELPGLSEVAMLQMREVWEGSRYLEWEKM